MVSWRVLERWDFDAIVLSPGPGRPDRWHDFGVCRDILRSSEIPVLGICLGHQGLGNVLRATSDRADGDARPPQPRPPRRRGLFDGMPQDFSVVRYHSLAITGPLGPEGRVTAWTDDGVVMGIETPRRPLWGVQFHPESIATEHGQRDRRELLRDGEPRHSAPPQPASSRRPPAPSVDSRIDGASNTPDGTERPIGLEPILRMRTIAGEPPTERVFQRLFGDAEDAFWLDSADAPTRLGAVLLPRHERRGRQLPARLRRRRGRGRSDSATATTTVAHKLDLRPPRPRARPRAIEPPEGIAAGLIGGYVGYLGYECKADCGSPNVHRSDIPDAVMMFANRVVAVDHVRAPARTCWR